MTEQKFKKLVEETLHVLEGYEVDKKGNKKMHIVGIEKLYKQLNLPVVVKSLPSSTQLISDCKKRFKELEGKGNLDYRSYQNGYLDSFSKNVVSKIK